MAHIYKYAILTAIPDAKRGERVNVGIVIFLDGDIDVRFSGVAKLAAISGGEWSGCVAEIRDRMKSIFVPNEDPGKFAERYAVLEDWIQFSDVSWFAADTAEEYENRIDQIVAAFIRRPREERSGKVRSTRINTEIAAVFRSAKVLAMQDETIEDRDYYISRDEELRADFVHKNGVFHVTATLDLRHPAVPLGHAALKAIVLDKAPRSLLGGVKKYAVYAVEPGSQEFRPHIELLHDYSDNAFNWLVSEERSRYTHLIYSSLQPPFDLN
jgi:hypothetical protein